MLEVDLIQQIQDKLSTKDRSDFDRVINNYMADLKAQFITAKEEKPENVPETVAQRVASFSFNANDDKTMDDLIDKVQNAFSQEHSPRLKSDAKLTQQNENVLQAGNVGRKTAPWEEKNLDTPAINRMRDKRNQAFMDAINDPNKAEVAARAELSYRLALKAAPKLRPEAPAPRYEAPRPTPKLKPAGM